MVCALTVRTLKPGTFEQFREAFTPDGDPQNMPAGWVRFNMIRNTENPDESVGTDGLFEIVEDVTPTPNTTG